MSDSIAVAPIDRLDDAEKRFANGWEMIMQHQRRRSRGLWILLFLLLTIGALIFWLEWLGSEQPMEITEQPLSIPQQTNPN